VAGSLAHVCSKATVKATELILKIKVENYICWSTSMFNHIQACPLATMVAKTASIVVGGGPNNTNRLITQ
jgi:hypothetical protein